MTRNHDEQTITDAVLERLGDARSARMRQVSEALVRHLHDFIRDIEPTQAEWAAAIDFLTRVGHKCDDRRQEFILLSDTLGASMLVDAINHRHDDGATETTVLGPFFVEARPACAPGENIAPDVDGTPMLVTGSVSGGAAGPLAGASVDTWHADGDGYYDVQNRDRSTMRGRFETDDDGRFRFWTVRPSAYPIPDDGPVGEMLSAQGRHPYRPEHIHFMIAAEGFETLVTHVFARGDPYLDEDVVFGVKDSLVADYVQHDPGIAPDGTAMDRRYVHLHYDFILQPAAPAESPADA